MLASVLLSRAVRAGVEEQASFHQDDFATAEHLYPQADVVVLDRVVCCYPVAVTLLNKAARHTRQTLIFTYPRPFWFMPLLRMLCAFGMRLAGREYRFFLHDLELLLRAATGAGRARVVTRSVGVWPLMKVSGGQETVGPPGCDIPGSTCLRDGDKSIRRFMLPPLFSLHFRKLKATARLTKQSRAASCGGVAQVQRYQLRPEPTAT